MKMLKYFGNPIEVSLKEALEEIDNFPMKDEYEVFEIVFINEKTEEIGLNKNVEEIDKDFHFFGVNWGPPISYIHGDLTLPQVKDIITHFYHGHSWTHLYDLHTYSPVKEQEEFERKLRESEKELEEFEKEREREKELTKKEDARARARIIKRLEKESGKHYMFACELLSEDPEEAYIAYNDETLDLVIMKFKDPSGKYKLTSIEEKIKELIDKKKIECCVVSY